MTHRFATGFRIIGPATTATGGLPLKAGASPSGARTGRVIEGRYLIGALLGRGGMGEVYEAQHVVVGRRFAIKFLRRDMVCNERVLARFRREAQTAGSLEHDNIAAVFDFGIAADGDPYLVLEYLDGEDMARHLARGPCPAGVASALVLQAARGLAAAHKRGIVHRDLKPANIFLHVRSDGKARVKLLDFGIAKLRGDLARGGAPARVRLPTGTPQYMSPEQILAPDRVDERTDIYALGAILYEALSGRRPHPGESGEEIIEHVTRGEVTPLDRLCPDLAPDVLALVERAMARKPEDRIASARRLAAVLEPLADEHALEVRVTPGDDPRSPQTCPSPPTRAATYTEDGMFIVGRPANARGWRWRLPVAIGAVCLVIAGMAVVVGSARPKGSNARSAAITKLQLAPAKPVQLDTGAASTPFTGPSRTHRNETGITSPPAQQREQASRPSRRKERKEAAVPPSASARKTSELASPPRPQLTIDRANPYE